MYFFFYIHVTVIFPLFYEVGLDFTPRYVNNETDKEAQRQVLICQVQLAKELDLPLWVNHKSNNL